MEAANEPESTLHDELLTVDELAALLKVKKSWVYEHLDQIPHVRLGRYVRFEFSAVSQFVQRQRKNYAGPVRYQ
jgi:excisionase family DNA binding protein